MNEYKETCNHCIYNKRSAEKKNRDTSCPIEGSPIFADGGKNFKSEGPESATIQCAPYTCVGGVEAAFEAILEAIEQTRPIFTIHSQSSEEIIATNYETTHKPSTLIKRAVEVQEPHRFFVMVNGEYEITSERISDRLAKLIKRRQTYSQQRDKEM